ncbi:antibiotic biosynthesis monooxygenase [Roseomonas sp. OT10]|uniref:putative quinol monooxygenase n=1 Tax=Roseomonas cutis TaxID=2897332 RepID=UPI001E5F8817|nr:putative quinol monooxygenase [Roseomonas sp. OT10]UFN51446.1 antibiotic biosynthesis monooxygenase [Roseomonas sp. OT10]
MAGGYVILALWQARPGEAEAVASLLARVAEAVRRDEPGCRQYVAHRDAADDHRFVIYEVYDDEAAFLAHQQAPHFRALVLGDALDRLASRERRVLQPIPA